MLRTQPEDMTKIQLFDRGTPEGKKLWERLERVCQRLQIEYSPELTNKMEKVYQLSPWLYQEEFQLK